MRELPGRREGPAHRNGYLNHQMVALRVLPLRDRKRYRRPFGFQLSVASHWGCWQASYTPGRERRVIKKA
jgi:hypothetical protein